MRYPTLKPLLLLLCSALPCAAQNQQPPRALPPADALQNLFEELSNSTALPMFGKLTDEQARRLAQIEVSVANEQRFGKQVLNGYMDKLKSSRTAVANRGRDVEYLQTLCNSLKPLMQNAKRYRQLDIRVIQSDATDAYSIPGGHLLFTRGLLETCGSEAAVVGVLAHELSHLDRQHQLLPLKHAQLNGTTLDLKDQMLLLGMVARPFHPEQESEADADATEWMMAAEYEPKELVRLLESWQQRETQQVPWMQFIPTFVKSHPNPGHRATEILRVAERLKARYPQADFVGVNNWKQRTPRRP
ncbi:MAG: M48 family metallopeptidase [Pirellulaceae bacterium]